MKKTLLTAGFLALAINFAGHISTNASFTGVYNDLQAEQHNTTGILRLVPVVVGSQDVKIGLVSQSFSSTQGYDVPGPAPRIYAIGDSDNDRISSFYTAMAAKYDEEVNRLIVTGRTRVVFNSTPIMFRRENKPGAPEGAFTYVMLFVPCYERDLSVEAKSNYTLIPADEFRNSLFGRGHLNLGRGLLATVRTNGMYDGPLDEGADEFLAQLLQPESIGAYLCPAEPTTGTASSESAASASGSTPSSTVDAATTALSAMAITSLVITPTANISAMTAAAASSSNASIALPTLSDAVTRSRAQALIDDVPQKYNHLLYLCRSYRNNKTSAVAWIERMYRPRSMGNTQLSFSKVTKEEALEFVDAYYTVHSDDIL